MLPGSSGWLGKTITENRAWTSTKIIWRLCGNNNNKDFVMRTSTLLGVQGAKTKKQNKTKERIQTIVSQNLWDKISFEKRLGVADTNTGKTLNVWAPWASLSDVFERYIGSHLLLLMQKNIYIVSGLTFWPKQSPSCLKAFFEQESGLGSKHELLYT